MFHFKSQEREKPLGAESYKPIVEPISPTLPSTSPEPCPPPDPENATEPVAVADDSKVNDDATALSLVEEELTSNTAELVNTLCSLEDHLKSTSAEIERLQEKEVIAYETDSI